MSEAKPYLYKYVSPRTGRAILETRTLRWSTPPLLNDPFDMQFAFQVRVDRAAVKNAALRKLWDAHYGPKPAGRRNRLGLAIEALRGKFPRLTRTEFDREFSATIDDCVDEVFARVPSHADEIKEHFANDKILCLSELPDSIAMWAYYAENHSGMVLSFGDAPGVDSPWETARSVRYVKEVPSIFNDESLSAMLSGEAMDHSLIVDTFVYTKSAHWEHEREWRIYSGRGRTHEPHEDIPFNALELHGVIFGCRMPASERDSIADLVRSGYAAATLFEATTRTNIYGLAIEPLIANGPAVPAQVAKAKELFAKGWGYNRIQAEAFWPQVHQGVRDYFLDKSECAGF
jgi:hypothetical protein